jgi:hypothetical protein
MREIHFRNEENEGINSTESDAYIPPNNYTINTSTFTNDGISNNIKSPVSYKLSNFNNDNIRIVELYAKLTKDDIDIDTIIKKELSNELNCNDK